MIDPQLNQQVLDQMQTRSASLDRVLADRNSSPQAKAEATAAKNQIAQERALREKVAAAKTPAEQKKAEQDLNAYRQRTCPAAGDGNSVTPCRPTVVYVHIHMRFLLPKPLLTDMRDAGKYPRRAVACPAETFRTRYSFEGMDVPAKKRWSGDHPVVDATVKLAGKTAKTDRTGTAKFENVAGGTYTLEIEPPPQQDTTIPAGPDLPVRTGYSFDAAPAYKYRPFKVSATIDGEACWAASPEPTVTLPHKGADAAYAGVAGVSNMDLYLDWKPDWLKVRNRHTSGSRTNKAVVMHATATTLHEQIGSPIDTFNGGEGTAAHYLVDLDGHVVKLVHESEVTAHAASSHWHELDGLNSSGVGIETVHTDNNSNTDRKLREFTQEQYGAINRLVSRIRSSFGITKAYVCGHNDCRDGARDCPGDMFDWKSLEDAGNALRTLYGGTFSGIRVVNPTAQTADDPASPMSQELYKIGYTNKTVREALSRFLARAWSGSRYDARPRTSVEAVPPPPAPPQAQGQRRRAPPPAPAGQQVTQPVADAVDQMFRDL